MTQYPLIFRAQADSSEGIQSSWTARAAVQAASNSTGEIPCAIPAEFEGPATGFSPEDLFVLALLNCYIATLKVVAEKSKLSFASINGSAQMVLNKNSEGVPGIESVQLRFDASGVSNQERFQRLMERVSKQCMMINAVKCDVTFELKAQGS
jgi:organic hydroperoxide reductase OsmC/OhrA